MKVMNIQLPTIIKNVIATAPLLVATATTNKLLAQTPQQDEFIKTEQTDSIPELSPMLKVADKEVYPAVVVDLSRKELFYYDRDGYLESVYPVAVGKKSTPTSLGIRQIRDIEEYPYSSAIGTKRKKNPIEYGPKLLNLGIIDETSGKIIGADGKFIHGTNRPNSIGKNASKGCIRLNNDDIIELADKVKAGQYVLIQE